MRSVIPFRPARLSQGLPFAGALVLSAACASSMPSPGEPASGTAASPQNTAPVRPIAEAAAPSPDPRIGLRAGLTDAEEALWNLRVVSETPPSKDFIGVTNSDLAFTGNLAIQGNYNGYQVWNISNPAQPTLEVGFLCPASQSDVSVYRNLLFVSGEGLGARLDCGTEGVSEAVSHHRLRGIRIFDITDIHNPKYIGNVQTCRGSHTHSVLADPDDPANVYIYVSGSAPVRPAEELAGCSGAPPGEDPNSALFRIEVIRVPLANPVQAAIVSSPRIFNDLVAPPTHGLAPEDMAEIERAKARGDFVIEIMGESMVLPPQYTRPMLDSIVKARGGTGAPTRADSTALREALPGMIARMIGQPLEAGDGPRPGPTQCHDITVYPEIGLAGGACEGYGLLLDISDPVNPRRLDAVSDSNFSYWHSATLNNDGTKILFSDEWGGGGGPKCRASDPMEWGADAIFTIQNRQMTFTSYYKMPAAQTSQENCVAHNGSMIPIPGRDVMAQSWYQGGISVFDWTDPANPVEIAFHDRGPVDSTRMASGGSWSVYWYNGVLVSSEIGRGLDIFQLEPSPFLTQNEIDAARTIKLEYLNAQGQPQYVWPASFALARAYVDQLQRSGGLSAQRLSSVRQELASAERASGASRSQTLAALATRLDGEAGSSRDSAKVRTLAGAVRDLAGATG
ncbi:MAG: LVIVD repeat-containing protein [Longimicrobiales bacterium]